MKILKELSKIITKRKVFNIDIIDGNILKRKTSKLNKFYAGLINDQFQDDDDAAFYIYGSTPADERYRQLKTRFRRRLLNTLFFLEVKTPAKPNYKKALMNCEREWALTQILQLNNAQEVTYKLASNVFKTAKQYHFTNLLVESASLLRKIAAQKGDKTAFKTYNQYIHDYLPKREAEIQSEEALQWINQRYDQAIKKEKRDLLKEEIVPYCDQLISLSERYDAPIVNYNMFLIWSIRYELQGDYEGMLEVCEQAEQYLNTHPYFYSLDKATPIQIKKMSAYLHTKVFQGGKKIVEQNLNTIPSGSPSWFTLHEYYLLTAIHTENYISALAIYNRAAIHKNFKAIKGVEAKKWTVFEAYLHYFIQVKKLNATISYDRKNRRFNLDQFLNNQYSYSKEVVNLNVQLVTAQILFLLEKQNLREISNKINHLCNYTLPHLKRNQNQRTLYFVRLLQQLIRSGYDIDALIYKSRNLQRLQEIPFYYKGRAEELEIIPYEQCWQKITMYLNN